MIENSNGFEFSIFASNYFIPFSGTKSRAFRLALIPCFADNFVSFSGEIFKNMAKQYQCVYFIAIFIGVLLASQAGAYTDPLDGNLLNLSVSS